MFTFDDHLPHGNAISLSSSREDGIWTERFTPDAKGGAERLWFNARICNRGAPAGAPLRLVLCEADNLLGGHPWENQSHRSVWRADGGDWQRLPVGEEIRHPDGRLDISWNLPGPAQEGEIAVCMPYGEAQLRDSLAAGQDYWQESRIGTTCNGRSIPRLNNAIGGDHNRPGIYCTGRNHSGETPGAWALDGFIRRFAERNVEDVALWVVPFVDRDGVDEGRYGKDHWQRDFNRAWTGSQSYRHEVAQIQRDASARWAKRCTPVLQLDWHGPGMVDTCPHVHDEARDPEPLTTAMAEAYGVSPKGFRRNAAYASELFTELGMASAPNCTTWFRKQFGIRAITLETPYMCIGTRPLLIADYHDVGARIADACLEWIRAGRVN